MRSLVITITVLLMVILSWGGVVILIKPYADKLDVGGEEGIIEKVEKLSKKPETLIEKVEPFNLQEFGDNHKLSRTIYASKFFKYRDGPGVLVDLVVTTYDKDGVEELVIKSKLAHLLESGEIKFLNSKKSQSASTVIKE